MVIGGSGSISVYVDYFHAEYLADIFGGDTMSRLGGPKLLFPLLKIYDDRMAVILRFPVFGAEMMLN